MFFAFPMKYCVVISLRSNKLCLAISGGTLVIVNGHVVEWPDLTWLDLMTWLEQTLRVIGSGGVKFHVRLIPTHLISSLSLNLGGRRGTTDDVATILFHPSVSSAALRESPNPIPWCYLPISSSVFLSFLLLSLSLAELSSPCQRILRCGHT